MKSSFLIALLAISMFCTSAFSQTGPVKLSSTGICHEPGTKYYEQTKKFTSYKTLDECLKAGGRMPRG